MQDSQRPLNGVKVLDLTRVLAGPYCTQMLGDLGADVIKIERPLLGDDTRRFAPPFLKDEKGELTKESTYFMAANRNKRSVAVDISTHEGQEIIKKLADTADILVENFKPGNLEKFGLAYEDIKSRNPRLIYCSISGFGHTGPYSERPGYDFLIQAMGGLMSITGEPEGEPQKVGVPNADLITGMFASTAICAALYGVGKSGNGLHIDIGMLDVQVAWLSIAAMNYLHSGNLGRIGNAHPNIVPYQPFETDDGFIIVAIGNDDQFKRFCLLADQAELLEDTRFLTNENRVNNRDDLIELLVPIFREKTSSGWLTLLKKYSIGCGAVNNLAQVFQDPHVIDREMVHEMVHSVNGGTKVKLIASPFKIDGNHVDYRIAPPLLGEHTFDVLTEELRYTNKQILSLEKLGVVQCHFPDTNC